MARSHSLRVSSSAAASYCALARIFDSGATRPTRRKSSTAPPPSPAFCFASPSLYTLAARRSVRSARIAASVYKERSEEHTSELQSLAYLVCRLLLEKKKGFVFSLQFNQKVS